MSRSFRHTPLHLYSKNGASEKLDKRIWHQKMRAAVRQQLHHVNSDELLLPHECEVVSDWELGRGASYWFDAKEHPELMRK